MEKAVVYIKLTIVYLQCELSLLFLRCVCVTDFFTEKEFNKLHYVALLG